MVYRIKLKAGESIDHELAAGRGMWLQMVRGEATIGGQNISAGDAICTETAGSFVVHANSQDIEALLFDLA